MEPNDFNWGDIHDIEQEGKYREAHDAYFQYAVAVLLEWDFYPHAKGGKAIGLLNRAVSCAVRGDLSARARFSASIVDALTDLAPHNPPEVGVDAFMAACTEWSGDSYLLLGSERAITRYETALERYETVPAQEARSWGSETATEYSSMAIDPYLEQLGYDPTDYNLMRTEFELRLHDKLQISTELLGTKHR